MHQHQKKKRFLEHFRPEFPASKAGVSGPWTYPRRNSKAAEVLLSPWCGAEFPVLRTGVSAPGQTFRPQGTGVFAQVSTAGLLLSPWCGAEFPAPKAGVSAPGQTFRPQGTGVLAQVSDVKKLLSSWCGAEFPAPAGRSFRPRPEFPVTRAGNSGVILLDRKSTRLNSSHPGESRMPSSA